MEIHIHKHRIDRDNAQIFIFPTSNPILKNYIYRNWARDETIKYLESIK